MSGFLLYSDHDDISLILSMLQMRCGSSLAQMLPEDQVIIQWGNPALYQNETKKLVLNARESLEVCLDPKLRTEILALNGLPVASNKGSRKMATVRRYFAHVFQQKVLALFRSKGKKNMV